jgi:hypothetical protein
MAVGSKIYSADYNTIQKKVSVVLGTGGQTPAGVADGSYGYNQSVLSSQVAVGAKISAQQWSNLRSDLIRTRQFQTNATETLTAITTSAKVTDAVLVSYGTMADSVVTDRLSTSLPYTEQSARTTVYTNTNTSSWNTTITHTATMNFGSADALRCFFNTGSRFIITTSRTGGSTNTKNSSWTTMLTNMGSVTFARTTTTSTGNGTIYSIGAVNLTSSNQLICTKSTENPTYTPNKVSINVNSPTTSQLRFTITYEDLSYPGGWGVDEYVDGSLNTTIEMIKASGTNVSATTPTLV